MKRGRFGQGDGRLVVDKCELIEGSSFYDIEEHYDPDLSPISDETRARWLQDPVMKVFIDDVDQINEEWRQRRERRLAREKFLQRIKRILRWP